MNNRVVHEIIAMNFAEAKFNKQCHGIFTWSTGLNINSPRWWVDLRCPCVLGTDGYQLSLPFIIPWAWLTKPLHCLTIHVWVDCLGWLLLQRPQPGHTLFKALLYLRQLSSVSSPFAIYDCPISVCHTTAVSISSIYPFSACIQPRGIVKQIIVLILALFQVPIISDPVLTFIVQFGSQVMLIILDVPSGWVFIW